MKRKRTEFCLVCMQCPKTEPGHGFDSQGDRVIWAVLHQAATGHQQLRAWKQRTTACAELTAKEAA